MIESLYIKGTDESVITGESSVRLTSHDLSDLGSLVLIQINPKERNLRLGQGKLHDYHDVIVFDKLRFKNVFPPR